MRVSDELSKDLSSVSIFDSEHATHVDTEQYTLDELNKYLTLSYMRQHEPWRKLPTPYFPDPQLKHYPPQFVFGIGFRWRELVDFAYHVGIAASSQPADPNAYSSAWFDAIDYLMSKSGWDKTRYQPRIHAPLSTHADLVLTLWDNYNTEFLNGYPEECAEALRKVSDIWNLYGSEKRLHWFISDAIDLRVSDYRISQATWDASDD
ncbi:hypothetical protein VKT23_020596 [Stygiomarasmius scandens]|uniref:Uncharacterized protein n=1 Tax=Marasmiellus scandens TaxID=2682957 RepID=A0ABR1IIS5_9AGAR